MTSTEIRRQFLDFFQQNGHKIVPSVPIVVKNDPTLMFINAGMNPFKDIFLGNKPIEYPRIADTQKCLRVSGKHNDLEEVGVDTYHHTMFEMLGNWSFGDYFKEDAIRFAWTLLTEVYQLPKDRLYVTIFEGDAGENLAKDEDSFGFWKKYVAEDRILLGNKKDNFWEMGDTGPCGPCTEIHFDNREDEARRAIDGATLVNNDDPQVIEIWNLVFMQFNRKADKSLENLPKMHVDTGMGFERLVRAIQGKKSNYDTDLFAPLIECTEQISQKKYDYGDTKKDIAFRVIADHIRALSFTIADGQIPSNTGAGYVIRRILRRAVRYGYSFLGLNEAFLYQIVPTLAAQMADIFPELKAQESYIQQVIREEEHSFFRTLSTGIKLFNDLAEKAQNKRISGKDAFQLYDTYGFPFDLTQLMAAETGLEIDEQSFEHELNIQKERSKNATKMETEDWVVVHSDLDNKTTVFTGYEDTENEVHIVKYRRVQAKNQTLYQIVLDQTPFYAESGGQVGDTGVLESANGSIHIVNTIKENDTILHIAQALPDMDFSVAFRAKIDRKKRNLTTKNHSATHLLQAALRSVLGNHIEQKGSLVNENILRFDFSHFAKMTDEELKEVENIVNQKIAAHIAKTEERGVPLEEAKKRGVTALFGEKYGEKVRIIAFDPQFSMELCGGTHVGNTSEIEYFKIMSESSISAGIRRIEAMTSEGVLDYYRAQEKELNEIAQALKNPQKLPQAVQNLVKENADSKKIIEQYEKIIAQSEAQILSQKIENQKITFDNLGNLNAQITRQIATTLRSKFPMLKIGLLTEEGDKRKLTVVLGDQIVKTGTNAGQIIKTLSQKLGGGGGGQPQLATGSFPMEVSENQIKTAWDTL